MIQRREHLRFAREPRNAIGIEREQLGQHLDAAGLDADAAQLQHGHAGKETI